MLSSTDGTGWCLAVEPDGAQEPAVVARRVHEALTEAAPYAKGSTHEPDSR